MWDPEDFVVLGGLVIFSLWWLLALPLIHGANGSAMSGIVQRVLDNPSATVAVVAAALAFLSGVLGPLVQFKIGKRQAAAAQTSADAAMLSAQNAGRQEIARMRLEWMEKLRDTLSEYHSMLMSLDGPKKDEAAQKLSELGTELDLLLNQDDNIQKELWDVTDAIYNEDDLAKRQAMDHDLIKAGRAVLKAEWEKVKAEMRGQSFQTGS